MQNGAEIYIFASDGRTLNHLTDDYFTEGAEFTVTFGFDDNSTVSKKIVNYHQEEIDLSTNSEGPHAGVRYTLPLSEPTVSLTYDGKLRDRVSQANETRTGDSVKDGTFTLTVDPGNQPAFNMPNITKITLYSSAPGSWDTDDSTPSWTLGVAHSLDGDLLNGSNDNVDITVTVGGPRMVKLFAADWSEIEFVSETDITVTVDLADGSQMQKTITIP